MYKTETVNNFPMIEELFFNEDSEEGNFDRNYVVYVGVITAERGINEIVKAMYLIDNPNITLSLVGRFSPMCLRECVIREKGWEKVVEKGWLSRKEVFEELKKAFAGLAVAHPTPAYTNSIPTKIFEYMMASLPVITSDFPLWREMLEPYNCALFVDPFDAKSIAEAIEWLYNTPEEATAMGQRGKRAVWERYSWQFEERKLLKFYERILS